MQSETIRGKHLEARLVPASVGRRHVRQVASHVDEQRRRHGCEFRQGRCPVMERPHEPRILMTEAISMQSACNPHEPRILTAISMQGMSSSAISGPSNWQSSAISGPSNWQSSAISGPSNWQSSALSGPSNWQSSALSGPSDWQSSAISGPSNWQSSVISGPSNRQSSALSGPSEAIKYTHLPHHALALPLDAARWQRPTFLARSLAALILLLPSRSFVKSNREQSRAVKSNQEPSRAIHSNQ